jgi:hypothetical protein
LFQTTGLTGIRKINCGVTWNYIILETVWLKNVLVRVLYFPVSTDVLKNACLTGKKYFYVVVLHLSLSTAKMHTANLICQKVNTKNKVHPRREYVGPEGE